MEVSVFLPVRKGSERVQHKNTRQFSISGQSLLQIKISQLLSVDRVQEIVVSSNDPEVFAQVRDIRHSKIVVDSRPEWLCSSETKISDLSQHASNICKMDTILWTHVTSPFFREEQYSAAITEFITGKNMGYDSLATVSALQGYVLDRRMNPLYESLDWTNWPRTQDLDPHYVFNSAVFMAVKSKFRGGSRLGNKPKFLVSNQLESIDIDTEMDWKIAKQLYVD